MKFKKLSVLLLMMILLSGVVMALGPVRASPFPKTPGSAGATATNWFEWIIEVYDFVLTNWLGLSPKEYNWFTLFYAGIVPFLAVWIIVYGFMKEIRIFRRTKWTVPTLSFLIAFATLPTHFLLWIVNVVFNLIGYWSVLMFAGIFIAGTYYYFVMRKSQWISSAGVDEAEAAVLKSVKDELKILLRHKKELTEELTYETNPKKLDAISKQLDKVNDQLNKLRSKEKTVKEMTDQE